MLALLLQPQGLRLELVAEGETPLKLAEKIAEAGPDLVVVSYLPPGGFTPARYLVRRLRARLAELPILVGSWGETGASSKAEEQLKGVGASGVVFRLADAREQILKQLQPTAGPD